LIRKEELNREIKELKRSDTDELELVAHKLRERIKELNCLYDISSFRDATDFSLDAVLQAVVDFIPPAIQYPKISCARLIFGDYEVTTKNFKDTSWKLSREIKVNNKWIGTLELCYLEEKPELDEGPFLKEAKKGDPHKINYESTLTAISFISFFEKKSKRIRACSGYSIVFSLFLSGLYIPAAFFNKFSSLP
jgi:hypothetical protein